MIGSSSTDSMNRKEWAIQEKKRLGARDMEEVTGSMCKDLREESIVMGKRARLEEKRLAETSRCWMFSGHNAVEMTETRIQSI